ncbi:hypothetical protein FOFC_03542 [Fusarium oxysporum]|nr:hypothetical protein FOFC_03542 [Fusarium oxysporum]
MRLLNAIVVAAAFIPATFAALPTKAEGFASGTTGGKGGQVVRPKSNAELVNYLKDNTPRIIYLEQTFDFKGTEGFAVDNQGCLPWNKGAPCQVSLNANNWCKNYNPKAPKTSVKYDKAGTNPMIVGSNKSIIGVGSKGVIKGKGLRIVNAKNVIIQNIHITDLNPTMVWGGDAITLDGTDNIWIDHCTTSLIGRQHIVLGTSASGRVSITNNKIDGDTNWSANCNTYHYWAVLFLGSSDQTITFKGNYMYHVSGRAPKVAGNTLLHAVNNYFYDVWDHAFELADNAQVLAEGNIFQNVKHPLDPSSHSGKLFAVNNAGSASTCKGYLGRNCQLNSFSTSGSFDGSSSGVLAGFKGKSIAIASAASSSKGAMTNAGFGVN